MKRWLIGLIIIILFIVGYGYTSYIEGRFAENDRMYIELLNKYTKSQSDNKVKDLEIKRLEQERINGIRNALNVPNIMEDSIMMLVYEEAVAQNVPPILLIRMCLSESLGNPDTKDSYKGAKGLMQFMPKTFAWVKTELELEGSINDPAMSAKAAAFYLRYLYDSYHTKGYNKHDAWVKAVAFYNGGRRAMPGTSIADIRFKETRNYVKKVFSLKSVNSKIL